MSVSRSKGSQPYPRRLSAPIGYYLSPDSLSIPDKILNLCVTATATATMLMHYCSTFAHLTQHLLKQRSQRLVLLPHQLFNCTDRRCGLR
jgi:hypothetical protein